MIQKTNKKLIGLFILISGVILWFSIVKAKTSPVFNISLLSVYQSSTTTLGVGTEICAGVDISGGTPSCGGTMEVGQDYRFEVTVENTGDAAGVPTRLDFQDVLLINDVVGSTPSYVFCGCNDDGTDYDDWTCADSAPDIRSTSGTTCSIETGGGSEVYYMVINIASDAVSESGAFFIKIGGNTDTSASVSFTIGAPSLSCSVTPSNLSFGTLTTSVVSDANDTATTTITADGAVRLDIYDWGDNLNSDPGLWNSTSGPDTIVSPNAVEDATATLQGGTEGYGIIAATTTAGSGTLTTTQRYNSFYLSGFDPDAVGGLEWGTGTAVIIASSSAAVTDREIVVTHKAAISASTLIGDYKDTIIYTCALY